MNENAAVHLESRTEILSNHLAVTPDVVGATCSFPLGSGKIRIEIPSLKLIPEIGLDNSARLHVSGFINTKEGVQKPNRISVSSVDVITDIGKVVQVPNDWLLQERFPQAELSTEQIDYTYKLLEEHEGLAKRGFDLWARTLRWKSGHGDIGRQEVEGIITGYHTRLFIKDTNKHMLQSGIRMIGRIDAPVNLVQWEEAQKALQSGIQPPIYIELYYDGLEQIWIGEYRRAVTDLAVACETYLRTRVMNSLPNGLNEPIKYYIDSSNINQVVSHFFKETLNAEQARVYKSIQDDLSKLFARRNMILHSGSVKDLTEQECQEYAQTTKKLINITD